MTDRLTEDCEHPSVTVYPCFPRYGENVYVEARVCDRCGKKVAERTERREWPPFVGEQR